MRAGLGAVLLILTVSLGGSATAQHHGPTPTPPVPKQPTAPVQQQLQQKQIERNLPDGFARPTVAVPDKSGTQTKPMPPLWPDKYHPRGTAVFALTELMKQQPVGERPIEEFSVTARNGGFIVSRTYIGALGDRWIWNDWVPASNLGIAYPADAEGWSASWSNPGGKQPWPYDDHGHGGVGPGDVKLESTLPKPAEPVRKQEDYSHIPADEIPHDLREGLGLNLPANDPAAVELSRGLAQRDAERAAETQKLAHQIAEIGMEAGIFAVSTVFPVAGAIIGGSRGFANAYLKALEEGASETEAMMRGFGAAGVNVSINLTGGKLADAIKNNPLLAQSLGPLTQRVKNLVALNVDAAVNFGGNLAENAIYALGEIAGGEPRPDAWRYEDPFPPGQQYNLEM